MGNSVFICEIFTASPAENSPPPPRHTPFQSKHCVAPSSTRPTTPIKPIVAVVSVRRKHKVSQIKNIIESTEEVDPSIRKNKLVSEFDTKSCFHSTTLPADVITQGDAIYSLFEQARAIKKSTKECSKKVNFVQFKLNARKVNVEPTLSPVPSPTPSLPVNSPEEESTAAAVAAARRKSFKMNQKSLESLENEFSFYIKDIEKDDITIEDYINVRKSWSHVLNDNLYMFHVLKQEGTIDSSDCLAWVYDTFYKYAYEYDDTLRNIFHENLKIQSKALMNLIQRSIRVARDLTRGDNVDFHTMYTLHKGLGINMRYYFEVTHILLITFRDCMGVLFLDEIEYSWNKLMSYILKQIAKEFMRDEMASSAAAVAVKKGDRFSSIKDTVSARIASMVSSMKLSSRPPKGGCD